MNSAKIGGLIAGVIGLVLLLGIGVNLISPSIPETPSESLDIVGREIVIVGGEREGVFAFALEGSELSSPGTLITVKVGEVLKITYKNIGVVPHSFAVHTELSRDSTQLFGAAVGSASRPLLPDQEGSVVITADREGSFTYVCTVPGHIELGMFGTFVVEG